VSKDLNNALDWGNDKGLYVAKGEMGQADTELDSNSSNPIANSIVVQTYGNYEEITNGYGVLHLPDKIIQIKGENLGVVATNQLLNEKAKIDNNKITF
jgi:hypothetical protein